MSNTTVDTSNQTGNYEFEACDQINEGEARAVTRAGFDGLLNWQSFLNSWNLWL